MFGDVFFRPFHTEPQQQGQPRGKLRFVGLDVHKETIVIAIADEGRFGVPSLGEPMKNGGWAERA